MDGNIKILALAPNGGMGRRAKQKIRQTHYIREWREHCGYSLAKAVDILQHLAKAHMHKGEWPRDTTRLGATKGNLSRIERGEVPYNQFLLELLAEAYKTDPASLLMRDPSQPDAMWSLWDRATPAERVTASRVIEAIISKKTGTDG